ncbi:MAG: hypothetical protein EB078_13730 [Proteobacteria bacterium]|nr:hypothetical protein [Pseudomonadota bacterium]NDC26173.1 hypothetical protein [Pseudomonadota bacterium]NDD05958.1 hypothetical protein [Pseudomonadota bacterium]
MVPIIKKQQGGVILEMMLFISIVWIAIFQFSIRQIVELRKENRKLLNQRIKYDGVILWKNLKPY